MPAPRRFRRPPAVAPTFPVAAASRLWRRPDPAGATLPGTTAVLVDTVADPGRLARYRRLCGLPDGPDLPVCYPHLAGFRLTMRLLTGRGFPLPAMGLLHTANRIAWRRPIPVDTPLTVSVEATALEARPHGLAVTIVTRAAIGDDDPLWWEHSEYLHHTGTRPSRTDTVQDEQSAVEPRDVWTVPAGIGRRYARVSGDYNPIHLSGPTARALGRPGAIAHGMWSLARCLADIDVPIPRAGRVDCRFGAPLPLPSRPEFGTAPGEDGHRFALRVPGARRPHLTGSLGNDPGAPSDPG